MSPEFFSHKEAEEDLHFGDHETHLPLVSVRWHVHQLIVFMLEQQEYWVSVGDVWSRDFTFWIDELVFNPTFTDPAAVGQKDLILVGIDLVAESLVVEAFDADLCQLVLEVSLTGIQLQVA